jgi:antitoxin ParD1/3/4
MQEATMNISLTPQLEAFVQEKVASGLYASASEVIREALRVLEEQDKLKAIKLEALRKEIDKGLEQLERGERVPFEPEKIIEKVLQRTRKDLQTK